MEVPVDSSAPAARGPGGLPAPSRRLLVLFAGIAVVSVIFWFGRDILAPFVVGILIVYLLDPVVERLARVQVRGRRFPRALLILLVYLIATLVLVELLFLLIGPLVEQVRAFARDVPGYVDDLNGRLEELLGWWNRLDLPADVKAAVDKALADLLANIGSLVPSILRPVFSSVLGFVGSIFGYLIIPVWTFWILRDRPMIVRAFDRAVPAEWRADTWAALGIVRRVFGSWVRGQLVLGLVVGTATFIGLLVLGALVDPVFSRYAVLLAVIAGVLELLPVIGPDHRGDPRHPPRRDSRGAGDGRRLPALPRDPAGREHHPRAQDPGRRHEAPPGRGHLRPDPRRGGGRPPRRDPRPAGRRDPAGPLHLCLPAGQRAEPRGRRNR